tara:strand:- start:1085 stop:1843 length:759 start_codon:yes stop_codon:yes gene_type:complete
MNFIRKIFKYKNQILRSFFSRSKIQDVLDHNYTIYFNKNKSCELSKLCNFYKTNKGYVLGEPKSKHIDLRNCHSYSDFYSDIFLISKKHVKKVFELGIGSVNTKKEYNMSFVGKDYISGGSLRVWREYFYNAQIYGADIDKECLFTEERIKTFFVDQGNKDSVNLMWNNIKENNFDIIIDDGCHRFEETIIFFENSIDKLHNNGVYIIEDILLSQRKKFLNYFKNTDYNFKFVNFYRPNIRILNNSLILITK